MVWRLAMRFRSIRWQLSLTYAGIALLTALVLNLLLRVSLLAYYDRQSTSPDNAAFVQNGPFDR
jgi:hypothetical protein